MGAMSLVPIHSKDVETQCSMNKDIHEFITTIQTAETVTQPGLVSLTDAILQAAHIHACLNSRPKLKQSTDPATFMNRSIDTVKLGSIVGCGDGRSAVNQRNVRLYFKETDLQPNIYVHMMVGGGLLYIWTSLLTYKQYVGQVRRVQNSLLERTKEHFGEAVRDFQKEGSRELNLAIRTHQKGDWILQILRFVDSDEHLTGLENYYIQELNTVWPQGYNMKTGYIVEDRLTTVNEVRDALLDLKAKRSAFNTESTSDSREAFIKSLNQFCRSLQTAYVEEDNCQQILKLDNDASEDEFQEVVKSCVQDLLNEEEGGHK